MGSFLEVLRKGQVIKKTLVIIKGSRGMARGIGHHEMEGRMGRLIRQFYYYTSRSQNRCGQRSSGESDNLE